MTLDTALTAYIWADGSAIPGRHPEAVANRALCTHVEGLIERMDAVTPGDDATDLAAWADRTVRALVAERDDVGEAGTGTASRTTGINRRHAKRLARPVHRGDVAKRL